MGKIRFTIFRHRLRNHRTGYSGRVKAIGTISYDQLINRVADMHTTVSRSELLACFADSDTMIVRLLQEGYNVLTGLVYYTATVQGDFKDESDYFDRSRHHLKPLVLPTKRLNKSLRDAEVEKVLVEKPHPLPWACHDQASGTDNYLLTPGGTARVSGHNMNFEQEDPQQGIFFVDELKIRTQVEQIYWKDQAALVFVVPNLAPGKYQLTVRGRQRNSEQVREGALEEILTVL